tara:strand:- start:4381 stop:4992 length:612 start_codon:yes stop_codon:yes gene_type:complete
MEATKLIFIGSGGHARVLISIAENNNILKVEGVFDHNEKIKSLDGIKNFGSYSSDLFKDATAIIAIGDNQLRKKIAKTIDHSFGNLVHSTSVIDRLSSIDVGSVVMHNAVIQRNTKIGKHCIVNTSSSIDHDCVIGDFVHLAPNTTVCGGVKIGFGTLVGAAAVIIPQISIGSNVIIGAGAIINQDIPDGATVLGNPGKIIVK